MKRVLTLSVIYDDATIHSHFGIMHEDALWLVTGWLIDKQTGIAKPERMIRVDECDNFPTTAPYDIAGIRLPRHVIEGKTAEAPGYEVRPLPDEPKVHRDDLYILPDPPVPTG